MKIFKAGLFAATAFATALGVSAPAFAGGGGHGARGHGGGYHAYDGRGYHGRDYYRGDRHYRGRHYRGRRGHRRHHGGGDAALIALGVIGGAIILNEVIEQDRRRDASRDAYDNRRYRSYDPSRDDYYYQRGDERAPDFEDRDYDNRGYDNDDARRSTPKPAPSRPVERDELDDDLLGGEEEVGFSIQNAFRACSAEARQAASRDGQFIAMPATPTEVETIDRGIVRMTANLTAQDQRGRQFLRRLTCEADARRVTFLQLS